MRYNQLLCAMLLAMSAGPAAAAHGPRFSFGVQFGPPVFYRPYCCYPRPIYYAPPVVVQPAPVIVQPPPVTYSAPVVVPPPPAPVVLPSPGVPVTNSGVQPAVALREPTSLDLDASIGRHLESLKSSDTNVRRDAVLELGHMKAANAVAPLSATLAGDASPEVRDAAARALGLIGVANALPALRYAAQADSDRDVRRSCQFAVDVIQTNLRK